ncbi:peptidyl-tRNA hydrolase [Thermocatellispora tengchongensis]|uniref:peptidyl-tRNA hydrolase n=1 Tax=Thermocatellispora tengchongensis TaxID=1073253 RepID=A0A840P1G3_9ACTN|nr:peptidyl-tRNA hydrolase [Thermocatellispora tengchongensis]MBB5135104.1 peptidyl-tRNA hydrolase [Thermocatellispora tengchongensis]
MHEAEAEEKRALPLVVRIERAEPPRRTDALEAAARAVLTLLTDPRVTGAEGEWAAAVRSWERIGIRKVVRRARGGEWRRVLDLPGITVAHRTAEVRVHPPVPLDDWPRDLARLQVRGTELDDPEPVPPPGEEVVLWLNPGLEMSAGKAMAQAGHAAQLAWWDTPEAVRESWLAAGLPLAVRPAPPERWEELTGSGLPVVRDAGFTEVAPGSCTVVAEAPWLRADGYRPAAAGPLRNQGL